MSTRYVYGIYDTTASKRGAYSVSLSKDEFYKELSGYVCNSFSVSIAENRYGSPVTHYVAENDDSGSGIIPLFTETVGGGQYRRYETLNYKYVVLTVDAGYVNGKKIVGKSYLLELHPSDFGAYWHSKYFTEVEVWNNNSDNSREEPENADKKLIYVSGGDIGQGSDLLRTESSSTSLQTGALTDGDSFKWRSLKGTDSIDPSAVRYSVNDLYSGEPFTITVTPRTPTYGGTVYYQYQYSTNGGSTWTNIGGKTTATSKTVTIPEGATQFQARVLSSDGWGFTSTTYVYGPAKEVSQLKAYVGVNAKARSLKKGYVGVTKIARSLIKGYVGVGGVAKKLF